eukprot:587000-Hanusia_phi.AAC.1
MCCRRSRWQERQEEGEEGGFDGDDRVEALQNALISEHKDLRIHEQKAEAKPPVKPVHNVSRPPAPEVKKSLPPGEEVREETGDYLRHVISPAPGHEVSSSPGLPHLPCPGRSASCEMLR